MFTSIVCGVVNSTDNEVLTFVFEFVEIKQPQKEWNELTEGKGGEIIYIIGTKIRLLSRVKSGELTLA